MLRLWNASPVRFVREMVDLYFSKRVSRSAAELAYFLVLTFFPILICVNAFIGLLQLDVNYILAALAPFLPKSMLAILSDYLGYITLNQSPPLFFAGLTMTLFSASAALRSLMNIMDDLYHTKSYIGVWKIVASVLFSVLLLVTIYLSLVVVLTGNWFLQLVEQFSSIRFNGTAWNWQWIKFLLLFAFVFLLIVLVYRLAAPRNQPRPPLFTGALISAVLLVASSVIFSWFIGLSSRYSLVYGSLASVIILLLWLYLCGNILILGNVFNCVWHRRKTNRI